MRKLYRLALSTVLLSTLALAIVQTQVEDTLVRMIFTALVSALMAFGLFELLRHWLLRRWLQFLVRWTRSLFRAEVPSARLKEASRKLPEEFRELTRELSSLALKMRQERLKLVWNAGRLNEEQEAFREDDRWQELRTQVHKVLKDRKLVIVANRQPYSHEKKNGQIEVVRPASGVVSALEPIMRMCGGGIWVGHGSGTADQEVVDANSEVKVPPENPTYTLRRVWLTKEEEEGYYFGFANEGLWPLCHLAYTRPVFRLSDWQMYQRVNEKFAETTLKGQKASDLVILVQDYHYALLPKIIRERAPEAAIELFWHIPWPNPEAFGICPQYKELLEGMLGADVVGFHTQFHCNNFLETCDRYLECRVDWERFSVTIGNHETLVRSYPISIATEPVPRLTAPRRVELREKYGIHSQVIALGVDRLDYTKGLVERIAGVERFLEKYPQYVGKFSFVEMGTPSRTNIPSYRFLIEEVEAAVARVNQRFGSADGTYRPVVLLKGHFDWREVAEFYQLGQVCLVTSLHDGMNLVAKEYVWSQDSDQGALILSRFTGAARELSEAIIINPYSTEEIADALYQAINWTREERFQRMHRMKEKVQNHNAFHWATDLLSGIGVRM
ncbi:MAG: trehalose-6-phosphate synthase [Bdellovibrionota bacterium]